MGGGAVAAQPSPQSARRRHHRRRRAVLPSPESETNAPAVGQAPAAGQQPGAMTCDLAGRQHSDRAATASRRRDSPRPRTMAVRKLVAGTPARPDAASSARTHGRAVRAELGQDDVPRPMSRIGGDQRPLSGDDRAAGQKRQQHRRDHQTGSRRRHRSSGPESTSAAGQLRKTTRARHVGGRVATTSSGAGTGRTVPDARIPRRWQSCP